MQVGQGHDVVVDDSEGAHTGGSQVQEDGAPEAARTDDEHTGRLELGLTGSTDLPQHDMARVALDLVARKVHPP